MARELNLLPPERRNVLSRQSMIGVIKDIVVNAVIALSVLTAVGISAIVLLQILLLTASRSAEASLTQAVESYQTIRGDVAKKNIAIEKMNELTTQRVIWSSIINELFPLIPTGVTITQIKGQDSPQVEIAFSGTATVRNMLIVLEDRLRELPFVTNVNAPASNLIERTNPTYSFQVTFDISKIEK